MKLARENQTGHKDQFSSAKISHIVCHDPCRPTGQRKFDQMVVRLIGKDSQSSAFRSASRSWTVPNDFKPPWRASFIAAMVVALGTRGFVMR